jgi:hypothetical protein
LIRRRLRANIACRGIAGRMGAVMEYMFLPLKRYAEFSGRSRLVLVGAIAAVLLWVLLLVFMLLDGTPGPNRFGPDPKARTSEEVFA